MSDKLAEASTKHPQYQLNRWSWRLQRDAIEGEGAIKRADTTYLPMPSGMSNLPDAPQLQIDDSSNIIGKSTQSDFDHNKEHDPSYHSNPAYMAYKKRAHFPDITASTLRGLMGLAISGKPTINLPAQMEYLIDNATKENKNLDELYTLLLSNLISQGRYILTADIDKNDDLLKIVPYQAKSFINWKTDINGLTLGVFEGAVGNADDIFSHDPQTIFSASILGKTEKTGDSQIYHVKTFDENNKLISEVIPSYKGVVLKFLPIVTAGSTNLDADVDIQPLYGIANTAVQMYQKSADLSMSEFMSCNPMLVMTGIDEDSSPQVVGSTVMLAIANDAAKVFYPATDTSALTHVMAHIDKLMNEAVSYGSNLLGRDTTSAESTVTVKTRQFQNGANLLSLVDVAGEAMESILKMIAKWMELSESEISDIEYTPNKEFSNMVMTAQEQQVLIKHWLADGMSTESYLWNLERSGLLQGTVEEELALIESQAPKVKINSGPVETGSTKDKNQDGNMGDSGQ